MGLIVQMRALHLFAGAGGSALAGRLLGWESVGAVEIDPYCCAVLEQHGERVLARDVTTFDANHLAGQVDVVVGGWPCQDLSVAGKRAGLGGERSGLFWQMMRVVDECQPRFVFGENVTGLLSSNGGRDFGVVLSALAARGYDARWQVLGARDVGAPHRRERVWILAYAKGSARRGQAGIMGAADGSPWEDTGDAFHGGNGMVNAGRGDIPERDGVTRPTGWPVQDGFARPGGNVANDDGQQREEQRGPVRHGASYAEFIGECRRDVEPDMGGAHHGLANGLDWPASRGAWPSGRGSAQHAWETPRTVTEKVPDRVARLKALGNGWVPQCAVTAWRMLSTA